MKKSITFLVLLFFTFVSLLAQPYTTVLCENQNYEIQKDTLSLNELNRVINAENKYIIETSIDTISKNKNGYFLGTKPLSKKELINVLKSNNESNKVLKKSRIIGYILYVPAFIGGFMIGAPLGASIRGGKLDTPVFGIGVAVTTATLISSALIESSGHKKASKAYNKAVLGK